MSVPYDMVKDFWDYLLFYPEEDEEGFDGVHDGGIKGIKDNAPDEAVEAYGKYLKLVKDNRENGIKM